MPQTCFGYLQAPGGKCYGQTQQLSQDYTDGRQQQAAFFLRNGERDVFYGSNRCHFRRPYGQPS